MSAPGRSPGGARRPDDWVERVRAASDIVEVISQTVPLKRLGRNWSGLCPFHKEKTPSFSVNSDRQFYHCFGCKAGGDVFRFVQETEKVEFIEAVELLSRRAGIPVPERRAGERGQRTPLLEALEQAAAAYEQWLADPTRGRGARDYLESRGLTRETVRTFRLGLAPSGWEHLATRLAPRLGESVLVAAGLAMRREGGSGIYDRFRDRLMVPLVAPGGVVVGFGARAMGDENPKYLNSPETAVYHKGSFLFGLDAARRGAEAAGEVVVVEGYFDTMALHQAGVVNTVATSGTALTGDQARLLRRASARVALAYDGDRAGQEATLRSLAVLMAEGLDVVVVDLPRGEDPDTVVTRGGAAAWNGLREAGYDPIVFIQRHVLRAGGSGDPRERALQAVVQLAAAVKDPIGVRLLLERATQVFGLPVRVLERAVGLRRSGQSAATPLRAAVREQRRGESDLERTLLRALLHAPDRLAVAREQLGAEDFQAEDCVALARWLWSGREDLPESGAEGVLARELAAAGGDRDWGAEVVGATRLMLERKLLRQLKERKVELSRAREGAETSRLMEEVNDLARSLKELSAQA